MKLLEEIAPDVRSLIVRLPFRVGHFLSESDNSGGGDAAEAEAEALRNIVTFYVEDSVKGIFAHEVMTETLNQKPKWDSWKDDIAKVPDECAQLTSLLAGIIEEKEVVAFKHNLLEVALVVAQAYQEIDDIPTPIEKFKTLVASIPRRVDAFLSGESYIINQASLNISELERQALITLAGKLGITFTI
ncbi:MAG: hypothetical protein WC043_07205 [Pseudobdellovibrionaceae bacterium]